MKDFERPYVTVDVVIFALIKNELNVLLVQRGGETDDPYPNMWNLVGGYVDVDKDDDLKACALRKLKEKTGLVAPYLEPLPSWGSKTRDVRHKWSVTHAFFALITVKDDQLKVGGNANDLKWFPVSDWDSKNSVRLAFDHEEILRTAIDFLRTKVQFTSLPAYLIEEPFTIFELQLAYEQVMDMTLDKSSFRKRALDQDDFLIEAGVVDVGAPHKAQTYRVSGRKKHRVHSFPRALGTKRGPTSA
jgi:ADP-ribose pyrophosphatase YjhB (NUDIX family)